MRLTEVHLVGDVPKMFGRTRVLKAPEWDVAYKAGLIRAMSTKRKDRAIEFGVGPHVMVWEQDDAR